ncbi:hypothetical protein [Oryzibacter oryziterrae]|uniref:hypothetical protein n=1 Tax=Oryzibacter oryziterrae TaxID=2766474 RepID=UPI001F3533DD|nr:hypothetical protein [Oryzibacter oryziterrae]
MSTQVDSHVKDQAQQGSQVDLDSQYHQIGIPAVNAAAHAVRRPQVQQKDYSPQQQVMFSYED